MSASPARPSTERKPAPKGWRRFFSLKRILLVMLGFFLLGVAAFGVAYAKINVPQPNDLANAQASIIYYDDGKTELDRLSEVGGNRESLPLSRIPVHVQRALLAAEDRSFYENNGVSPSGIARSVVVALKGGATQGGSTITQQYVKNYFLTQDRTITRKVKEFIISIKIDQQESKETILENYLNTIYYGRGAEGIQTASKAYFGHSASSLTVAEGALLASVIRGPSFYDPALGAKQKASAIARVDYVLDGMVTQGWLTPAERAKTRFPKTIKQARFTKAGHGPNGYITNEVRIELTNKLGLTETDIDRGGLRIVTTIDKKAQAAALKAVADEMPSGKAADKLHVGLTAIRPGDGAVVAMYGGRNSSQFNTSTQATMQGGSTFKVFGLLAALQKDISTKTQYAGYSPRFLPEFEDRTNLRGRVRNFEGHQYGKVSLRSALADSVNTVFAQLNVDLADGDKTATGVRDAAVLAGLPKACPPKPRQTRTCTPGLGTDMTNILGTASPHVIDMANAYATIAAQGRRATPYLITKVTSSDRRINYRVRKKLTPAFDKSVTADVTEAMRRVVTEGTGTGALELGRPAAGKTGTAEETTAVWFDGFTPQLSAAVGIYYGLGGKVKIPEINGRQISSGGLPVDIWTAFMKGALEGADVIDFPSREGVGDELLPPPPPPPTTPPPTTPPPTTAPPTTAPAAPTTAPTAPGPTVPGPTGPGRGGGPVKTDGPPEAPPTVAP